MDIESKISLIKRNAVEILNEDEIAKIVKKKDKPESSIRPSKLIFTNEERLQFILEGFPSIGPTTAKKILEHYKTLKNFMNTSKDELEKLIGKKAETIYKLINLEP